MTIISLLWRYNTHEPIQGRIYSSIPVLYVLCICLTNILCILALVLSNNVRCWPQNLCTNYPS